VHLEAYCREYLSAVYLERNLVLMLRLCSKLDLLESMTQPDAKKMMAKPEEGVRFCDLVLQELNKFEELPVSLSTKVLDKGFQPAKLFLKDMRCFFLALSYLV